MAGIFSQGGSAGHRYAGWLETVEAQNFQFGGKVFNGSPSAIFVGSKMVWPSSWLTFAAVQAILGAFGQRDGTAVIKATNAYLNGIADTQGYQAAKTIADHINQYPLSCALYINMYVQDGLLMQMDGMYGIGNGKWLDFIDGREFTFNDAEKCIVTADSIRFQNEGYAYASAALQLTTKTIEAVVRCTGNSGCVYDSGRTDSYLRWDATVFYAPTCSTTFSRSSAPLVGTVQATTSKLFENGVQQIKIGQNTSHTNDVATIGRARGGSWYAYHNAEICALRIYNRILTDAELEANRNLDVIRFALQTPTP